MQLKGYKYNQRGLQYKNKINAMQHNDNQKLLYSFQNS